MSMHLVKNDVSEDRIEAIGFGGEQPVYNNSHEASRKKNRRVEFVIIK